jgi:hypothetical protein
VSAACTRLTDSVFNRPRLQRGMHTRTLACQDQARRSCADAAVVSNYGVFAGPSAAFKPDGTWYWQALGGNRFAIQLFSPPHAPAAQAPPRNEDFLAKVRDPRTLRSGKCYCDAPCTPTSFSRIFQCG